MRVGLVLGAGGFVGVAYNGAVLATIEEATGWDPRHADIVVGTSAGSITGAMLRAGVPASDLTRISEDLPLSDEGARLAAIGRPHRPRPEVKDLLGFRPLADPMGVVHGVTHPCSHSLMATLAALAPAGGIPTEPISEGINAVFDHRWPAEPLWLCAVDLRNGKRVVFGREGSPPASVGTAAAASCAIPGYFRPVSIGGRHYVDGGVHSMVNLDLVGQLGLDLVIVTSPLSQVSPLPRLAAYTVMRQPLRAQFHNEVTALRRTGTPVMAIEPSRRVLAAMGLNPMNAAHRGSVSWATRVATHRWLTDGHEGRRLVSLLSAAVASQTVEDRLAGPVQIRRRPSA